MRTFQFVEGSSSKFWNIDLQGTSFLATFGRIGTNGQTQKKDYPDAARAAKEHDKLVSEKLKKGYVETTLKQEKPPPPLQASLEAALAESPDDLANHSAYADYLAEQGDARGELIQLQLALEDVTRQPKERKRLQEREATLLDEQRARVLGAMAPVLVGDWSGDGKPWGFGIVRGWLDSVRLLPFPFAALERLADCPEARLLRKLDVTYDMEFHPFEFEPVLRGPAHALGVNPDSVETYSSVPILPTILRSSHLTNLRVFKLGFSDDGDPPRHSTMVDPFGGCTAEQILELMKKCPRLDELYLNTTLWGSDKLFASPRLEQVRVLQYYFAGATYPAGKTSVYPLATLAKNKAAKNLTTLRLHPGREATVELDELKALVKSKNLPALTHLQIQMTDYGDDGVRAIVASGIIDRLKVLDLAFGNMTNAGAQMLADYPTLRKLESLNVSRNCLTGAGIAALKASGVRVVADAQHAADDTEYLWEVDVE